MRIRIDMNAFIRAMVGLAVLFALTACGDDAPDVISGEIKVAPALASEIPRNPLLVIEARSKSGGNPKGRPAVVAVQRVRNPKFPLKYFLGPPDREGAGRLSGAIQVTAKLFGDELSGETAKPFALVGSSTTNSADGRGRDIILGRKEPIRLAAVPKRPPRRAVARPGSGPGRASAGESISGTITVSPSLGRAPGGGVIFVIVRPAGVNAGPPLAVRRLRNSGFPLKYEVSEANVMIRGMPFQGSVNVTVRLDGDGRVGSQPGDLEGRAKQPVQVGDTSVDIVLDKRR